MADRESFQELTPERSLILLRDWPCLELIIGFALLAEQITGICLKL